MALSSLTATLQMSLNWTAQNNITGSDYSAVQQSTNIRKSLTVGTSLGNAVAGGADELISYVVSIAGGGTATIDFTSLTNILQTAGISLARVKFIAIRLLNVADDSVVGTAATYVTVGANATNPFFSQSGSGFLATNTSSLDVPSGGVFAFGTPSAAGVLVDGTHKILKIVNGDGAVTAKVQLSLVGGTS